jgi:hypothetical protein
MARRFEAMDEMENSEAVDENRRLLRFNNRGEVTITSSGIHGQIDSYL